MTFEISKEIADEILTYVRYTECYAGKERYNVEGWDNFIKQNEKYIDGSIEI